MKKKKKEKRTDKKAPWINKWEKRNIITVVCARKTISCNLCRLPSTFLSWSVCTQHIYTSINFDLKCVCFRAQLHPCRPQARTLLQGRNSVHLQLSFCGYRFNDQQSLTQHRHGEWERKGWQECAKLRHITLHTHMNATNKKERILTHPFQLH